MNIEEFRNLPEQKVSALPPALAGLWYDGRGDWEKAHDLVQDESSADGAWVHAYLHRKEGDQWNADYWYRRARREVFNGTLEDEWNHITSALLIN